MTVNETKAHIKPHRQYAFKSTGTIVYDPPRPGLKKKRDWWVIVRTCPGIVDYYRHVLNKTLHVNTQPPSWGSHISIIRGEKPKPHQMHLWKKYNGKKITFEYTHQLYGNGEHWWVNVYSPLFSTIREEFGLPSNWGQHLTVAKLHPNWPIRRDQWLDDITV